MSILNIATRKERLPTGLVVAGTVTAALGAVATWVTQRSRRAERTHPPAGRFVNVDGVRIHYLEKGEGTPVILLHGNLVYAKDFAVNGLVERLARHHRVLAFDRPGFGHSERPRDRLWTAAEQAKLVHGAFSQLGVVQPIVLGHSWGTLVALELGLRASATVQKLVLVSGYYFPTARIDVAIAAPPAIPLIGDVLRYTVSPLAARFMLNRTIKTMFAPQPVPLEFLPALSREMLVRPVQIRANAEDAAFMIPAAAGLRKRYGEVTAPVVIFAGGADQVVAPDAHARRLHAELNNSTLRVLPGVGHMVHYAAPEEIVAAISS